jgi:Fe-S-cluster-containing dehydrogenase component
MAKFVILTDLNRCVGCMSCSTACKTANSVPIGNFWNKVLRIGPNPSYKGAIWPDVEWYYLPIQCQHCENPECVKVCPTGASHKIADGSVQVDKSKCVGCQFCVMACPYNVRYLNEEQRVVEKCTLCDQKIAQGELPQCVAECVGMAKWFGDAEEDSSMMSFRGGDKSTVAESCREFSDADIHALPNVGNNPSFRYILRGKKWQGGGE